ncbi:DNA-binding protein WhiA [bacterium]|nr:DNA-binding protein WhiA [bacterium]
MYRNRRQYIYSDEQLARAYLRGVFLSCGSINDPKKSRYHLEFIVDNEEYADFISSLLNQFDLNSKVLKRENKYMIYMKEAEKISDFLRLMQAIQAVFYYEDIRIYRDHKNMTNRLNNCEQANVDKIIETAMNQLKDIKKIEDADAFDLLDEKTKEAAIYRKKYPETSLLELSEIISIETGNTITKSGLYHRFHKIKEFAQKIK